MTQLPTDRTTDSTIAEHTSDHNILCAQHNELDGHAADTSAHDLDTITTALAGKSDTSHDHDADYEVAGSTATHSADTTSVHGIADTSALALTSHDHSGTYVPVPAGAPTPGQILSATDDDPLTTDWIDAPSGGGGGNAIFGDGFDGVINFDGTTTRLGLVPASGVYTLNRDIYLADGSQISGTAVVVTANFRIFCAGTFTVGTTATLHNNGINAVGSTQGLGTNQSGSIGPFNTGAGGNGSTGNGSAGQIATTNFGGFGGPGGTGSGGAGGGQRNPVAIAASRGNLRSVPAAITNMYLFQSTAPVPDGGGCGGSSGGGDGANLSGAGGGGGGILLLVAKAIVNSGTISANGGNAGNASAGNCGGGGGGGGGAVFLIYNTFTGNAATATGGAAGTKTGTGLNGTAGGAGKVVLLVNA